MVAERIRLWLVACVDIFGGLIQLLRFPNGQAQYLLLLGARRSQIPSISCRYQIYLPCGAEHGISAPGLPNAYPATAISLSLDVTGTFASLARIRLVTLQVRKRNVKFFSLSLKENGETVRNDEFLRLKCLSLFKDSF